ncbi:MAG: biotin--[acetyl-CoA-carboxylase] ligase [Planctomycetes bacterium]|nr:biotin--[acetyl-CoA-carboxylase] ligase [Planctomycetota bacterium]
MPINSQLNQLLAKLPARRTLAQQVEIIEQCISTNDELKARQASGINVSNSLLIARHQQGGRGRSKRDWWSGAAGENLCFSMGIPCTGITPHIIGLLGAVALASVCENLVRPENELSIKWPNDILVNGAKLAGFLCELPANESTLILGLGVNVASSPTFDSSHYATTSLAQEGCNKSPLELLSLWLFKFEQLFVQYKRVGSSEFELRFIKYLKKWAPNGVRNLSNQKQGALLKFSVAEGLTIGVNDCEFTQAMESIHRLEKIDNDT